ncbi:MAG: hypothetical protein GX070_05890 [Alcaligenaceae bacterium]|nr:hypothetical protein [Alcaligenaceae bacterium]
MPGFIEILATVLFAIAIIHTFSVSWFARLAHKNGPHAGLWHLLSEVEGVFGVWAAVLIVVMALASGLDDAIRYMDSRNFTEPLFVFAIMVVAASRPILQLVSSCVRFIARVVPVKTEVATFFITLSLVPLAGSFITEPAAMTLAALMLKEGFFTRSGNVRFKYLALGVLFVNVSIGGVLTAYAAPPVLMVAQTFGWDSMYMLTHFGWKAVLAVIANALIITLICRKDIESHLVGTGKGINAPSSQDSSQSRPAVPAGVILIHLLFLTGIVLFAHHTAIFMGLLMLFIGYCEAYKKYQDTLMVKEGLMVGFFLAGLIILGGLQQWWLQDLLGGMPPMVLYWGATILTAVTDNAALTYLGSLVEGTNEFWRYMLVAGAVTGGGLTVIANAPNPAGFSILRGCFPHGSIAPQWLFLSALLPTLMAAVMFLLPIQIFGTTGF